MENEIVQTLKGENYSIEITKEESEFGFNIKDKEDKMVMSGIGGYDSADLIISELSELSSALREIFG
jgi:muramoyltetrapeptide carboxypeptidase LdcA involved in peptidoglycan recycling